MWCSDKCSASCKCTVLVRNLYGGRTLFDIAQIPDKYIKIKEHPYMWEVLLYLKRLLKIMKKKTSQKYVMMCQQFRY